MTDLILPVEVRDALLRYLVSRPYGEVAEGVAALLALKPAPEPEHPSEEG